MYLSLVMVPPDYRVAAKARGERFEKSPSDRRLA